MLRTISTLFPLDDAPIRWGIQASRMDRMYEDNLPLLIG